MERGNTTCYGGGIKIVFAGTFPTVKFNSFAARTMHQIIYTRFESTLLREVQCRRFFWISLAGVGERWLDCWSRVQIPVLLPNHDMAEILLKQRKS